MNYYTLITSIIISVYISLFVIPFNTFMFGLFLALGYLFMTVLLGAVIYDLITIARERFFG